MDKSKRTFYSVKRSGTDNNLNSFNIKQPNYYYNDKKKRDSLYFHQGHYFLSNKGAVFISSIVGIFILYILRQSLSSSSSSTASSPLYSQLLEQPTYTQPTFCHVELCNPSQRCSTWYADPQHLLYDWDDLSKENVYRDVATIKVDPGCNIVSIQVQDENAPRLTDGTQWVSLSPGQYLDCMKNDCRNVVAMKIQNDIYLLASQLASIMDEDPNKINEEIILARPVNSSTEDMVTLVSQFSVNRLNVFSKVIEAWQGPISVTIYLTEQNDIEHVKTFFEDQDNLKLYEQVGVTLVKPSYDKKDYDERLRYPINHLRNLAIMSTTTPYIYVIDADFVPSATLYLSVQNILASVMGKYQHKTALVVPCFAIHEQYKDTPLPESMEDVKQLIDQGIAYITDDGAGHGPTLGKELAVRITNPTTSPITNLESVSYEVCYESQWEPYYIIPRNSPLYDVRFKNQGGDKQSHALHLNAEGYKFMVLHKEFMIHKDHSKMVWPGGGFPKAQKDQQLWNYFGGFMREMESLYGLNVRWPYGCSSIGIGWQEQRRNTLGMAVGAI